MKKKKLPHTYINKTVLASASERLKTPVISPGNFKGAQNVHTRRPQRPLL